MEASGMDAWRAQSNALPVPMPMHGASPREALGRTQEGTSQQMLKGSVCNQVAAPGLPRSPPFKRQSLFTLGPDHADPSAQCTVVPSHLPSSFTHMCASQRPLRLCLVTPLY